MENKIYLHQKIKSIYIVKKYEQHDKKDRKRSKIHEKWYEKIQGIYNGFFCLNRVPIFLWLKRTKKK